MSKKIIRQKIDDSFLRTALKNFAAQYPVARARAFEGDDFEAFATGFPPRGKRPPRPARPGGAFPEERGKGGRNGSCVRNPGGSPERDTRTSSGKRGRVVVKSKSMTSEEIRLNPYLEKAGIRCLETDLGEWIIQLAGERPPTW